MYFFIKCIDNAKRIGMFIFMMVQANFNLHTERFSDLEDALLWIKSMRRNSGEAEIASFYRIGKGKVVMV